MNTASVAHGASLGAAPKVTTLRTLIEGRRAEGRRFSLDEAIAIIVPLCLDLKERHDRGERLYVHPGCIAPGGDGLARLAKELAVAPTNARDRMCLAPELQAALEPGDARASVFSVGAVLYELVTGEHIGPAMRRPRDIDPELPDSLEGVLAKALVGNPAHRPNDLGALASAMHHVAPMKSIPPPDADESRLDHTESFDVDIRLSMLPPSEVAPTVASSDAALYQDPYAAVMAGNIGQPSKNDPTARLAALKARLESDPRPRYVVNKDKMDHGPFSAVELLQQITSNSFTGDHILRDEISGQSQPIREWEEFAQFSDQAALKREIVAEKKAVEHVAEQEKKAGFAKSTVGIAVVVALLAVISVFIFKAVGSRNDSVTIADDKGGVMVDPAGNIKGQKRNKPGGGGGGTGMPGGLSFEAAWATAEQKVDLSGPQGRDLTQEELGRPLQNASFISGCGAPDSMKVTVKVAVKMGRAVGVSVYTTPPNGGVASCIDRSVRGQAWPVSQNMDAVTTSY